MKMSKWVLRIKENEIYKKIELISSGWNNKDELNDSVYVYADFIERYIEPKFYCRIKLTPIEAIKLGTRFICLGIESIKKQNNGAYKPSNMELKGFDECIIFVKKILKGETTIYSKTVN